ncbi:MAG: hypothetical protein K2L14_04970 [Duncaniella sp.]|nr:hypothetical protein [Duncaniella sp.]
MVTKAVIDSIYRQYDKAPRRPEDLNLALLFDYAFENHGIIIDDNDLYITSIDPASPFACIPLDRIHQILEFSEVIAIVLPSAIIFLNKKNSDVNIHIKMERRSLWDKLSSAFSRIADDLNPADMIEEDIPVFKHDPVV